MDFNYKMAINIRLEKKHARGGVPKPIWENKILRPQWSG